MYVSFQLCLFVAVTGKIPYGNSGAFDTPKHGATSTMHRCEHCGGKYGTADAKYICDHDSYNEQNELCILVLSQTGTLRLEHVWNKLVVIVHYSLIGEYTCYSHI